MANKDLLKMLVVCLGVGSILLLYTKKNRQTEIFYLKDNALYMKHGHLTDKEAFKLSGNLAVNKDWHMETFASEWLPKNIYLSQDGATLVFPYEVEKDNRRQSVFVKNLDRKKEDVWRIDSDIQNYMIDSDGTCIAYEKGTERALYLTNFQKKEKIASGIIDFKLYRNGKSLLYLTEDNTLHMKKGKRTSKMDDDVAYIAHITADEKTVYYMKTDGTLCRKRKGKGSENLLTDVCEVVKIYDNGEIYFLRETTGELSLYGFTLGYYSDDEKEIILSEACLTEDLHVSETTPVLVFYARDLREYKIARSGRLYGIVNQEGAIDFTISSDGNTIFYVNDLSCEDNPGDIYKLDITDRNVTEYVATFYDRDVALFSTTLLENDQLIYFKNVEGEWGDLYYQKKKLDTLVYMYEFQWDADRNRLYYYRKYDAEKRVGQLKQISFETGAGAVIAEQVHDFQILSKNVVCLCEEEGQKNLYLCGKGKKKLLDEDVIALVEVEKQGKK